ncbi:MAG: ATP-binding cassette domain-containing protein, partial [Acholeplasmataceae bacterium]
MVKKLRVRLLRSRVRRLKERIYYLESFLPVYRESLEQKRDHKLERLNERHKRILLPLEVRTLTDREYQEYRTRDRIDALKKKYGLKERALRHRFSKKDDDERKDQKLEELRSKLKRRIDALQQAYARQPEEEPREQRIRRYREKKDELKEAFSQRKSELDRRIEVSYQKEQAKLKRQLAALKPKLEEAKNALDATLKRTDSLDLKKDFGHDILRIEHLTMMFGGLKAVNDLSFSVKKGEIFGLIGPNGAGKTTVFNCITQFYKSNTGNAYYRNRNDEVIDLGDYAVHDVIRQGIARTFQHVELILELSVIDNMLIGSHSAYRTSFFEHLVHSPRLKRE